MKRFLKTLKRLFNIAGCWFSGHVFVRSHPDDIARCVHCNAQDFNNEHP